MTQEAAAKKDTQRLQRAIVDGLEDVKAHDIAVFNTEHLSPLFERVIVASGTSNRQTKALAASVRDAVREAGFPKPRIEGEENGEWIIVDCGAAVAHIMQPAIRQYYHLEEIWGEKPVRVKFGAPKPAMPSVGGDGARKTAARKAGAKKAATGAASRAKPLESGLRRNDKVAGAKKAGAASKAAPAGKSAAKKSATGGFAAKKPGTGGAAAKKPAAKKPATKKAPARKAAPKRRS